MKAMKTNRMQKCLRVFLPKLPTALFFWVSFEPASGNPFAVRTSVARRVMHVVTLFMSKTASPPSLGSLLEAFPNPAKPMLRMEAGMVRLLDESWIFWKISSQPHTNYLRQSSHLPADPFPSSPTQQPKPLIRTFCSTQVPLCGLSFSTNDQLRIKTLQYSLKHTFYKH